MREGSTTTTSTPTSTLAMGDQAEGREDGFEVIARSVGACVVCVGLVARVILSNCTERFSFSVFLLVARSRRV